MNKSLVKTTDALCAETDPELFFAQDSEEENGKASYVSTSMAKHLCAQCPLTLQCLRTAVENKEEYGIWGGAMPRERRYIHTKAQAEAFVAKLKLSHTSIKRNRKR